MGLQLTTTGIIYLAIIAIIFAAAFWAGVLAILFAIEKLTGNKQIIDNLLKEKKDRDLREKGLKQELNKLIDESKKFQFSLEPTPHSKKLDEFFSRSNIN